MSEANDIRCPDLAAVSVQGWQYFVGCDSVVTLDLTILENNPMVLLFNTSLSEGTTIKIPITGTNIIIDWGDGNIETVNSKSILVSHTYATEDVYTISIKGVLTEYGGLHENIGAEKLVKVISFGGSNLTSLSYAFNNAKNLIEIPKDIPPTITSLNNAFSNAASFSCDISSWDISSVTNMDNLFLNTTLSTKNYDDLLLKWSNLSLQSNVSFNGGNSSYSSISSTARQRIIDDYNWAITDKGMVINPEANFSYTLNQKQITFINKSSNADSYLWKFGDGTSSVEVNPIHNYVDTGTYNATLFAFKDDLQDSINVKIDVICSTTTSIDVQEACDSYTWIDGNTYIESNNTAKHILTNAVGCDSIATLNLTINTVVSTVTVNNATITAKETDANYQWINCESNSLIDGETNQSFTAQVNGDYGVVINKNECIDTSNCVAITSIGIIESSFVENIQLYPNPTERTVNIDLGKSYNTVKIVVRNITGAFVEEYSYEKIKSINLNLDEEQGVYFIEIFNEAEKAVIKVIKQ